MSANWLRRLLNVSLILGAVAVVSSSGRVTAIDPDRALSTETVAEARAIVERGIRAMGGEEKLLKYRGLVFKGTGKFYLGDDTLPFKASWHTQGLTKSRTSITIELDGGARLATVVVLNGSAGWARIADEEAKALEDEVLREEKENLHFNWVTWLVPLKGQEYQLTYLGERKLDNKRAVVVKVSTRGRRDIKLFFDKETALLLKGERPVRDVDNMQDATEEMTYSDYKDVQGLKVAMTYQAKWDGKKRAEAKMTEAKFFEKIDDKWFDKP